MTEKPRSTPWLRCDWSAYQQSPDGVDYRDLRCEQGLGHGGPHTVLVMGFTFVREEGGGVVLVTTNA